MRSGKSVESAKEQRLFDNFAGMIDFVNRVWQIEKFNTETQIVLFSVYSLLRESQHSPRKTSAEEL